MYHPEIIQLDFNYFRLYKTLPQLVVTTCTLQGYPADTLGAEQREHETLWTHKQGAIKVGAGLV